MLTVYGHNRNANQNITEISSNSRKAGHHEKKKKSITYAGVGVGSKAYFYIVGGNINQYNYKGKQCGDAPENKK